MQWRGSIMPVRPFRAPYAPTDEELLLQLCREPRLSADAEARIDARASRLIETIRASSRGIGGIEDFLHEYSLSTKEGLALMVLAEALLRVPDSETADRLIADKLAAGDFAAHVAHVHGLLMSASAWALGMSARIVETHETPDSILAVLVRRLGAPAIRTATRAAMRLLGAHFVLGQTIEEALARAGAHDGSLYSFDMLGEGARTAGDADRYFESYAVAIEAIGKGPGGTRLPRRNGISVKLSALHPRFEAISRPRVLAELPPRLSALARAARAHDLNFTVDAEEADRLELSLDVIAVTLADPTLAGWDGFGVAVQAYQKRAGAVIDWLFELAAALDRRLMIRLVKGAYWDTEIKRAQERGLEDYPVFTRKAMTDLNYIACARQLLARRERLFPQFATHNALTVATLIEAAGDTGGFEFQRLHGMGEALYATLSREREISCRVYAPVGTHRDLLAYLVRRLLENGANSSFVSAAADPNVPVATILERPDRKIAGVPRNPSIPLPASLYPDRANSHGIELGDAMSVERLLRSVDAVGAPAPAAQGSGAPRDVVAPAAGAVIATICDSTPANIRDAVGRAAAAFSSWDATPLDHRAVVLQRAADLFEAERASLIALLREEAGKTLDDCVAEVREAADFCRYYALALGRLGPDALPGPTGESNQLRYRGRGVFACISPWNFPLSIFAGQIAAALLAGNGVVAKPAEQTPLIAGAAVRLLHKAGVPESALQLVYGNGEVGTRLVADAKVDGVVFTGSLEVAQRINAALASRTGPIAPLIAETGGVNAMIVDATALAEQVTDDVLASAFRSTGQRCSALRLLCLQEDVADAMLAMISGAARELSVGEPNRLSTHVGPVIDGDAKSRLQDWIAAHRDRILFRWDEGRTLPDRGFYVPPTIIGLKHVGDLSEEVFGPVLHVVRYRAGELDRLLDDIAGLRYGLTLGIHSRIEATVERVVARLNVGNVYVNRNMIGAVVGTQPFGGSGLSGTGPKAGGPNYLRRFAIEQTVSVNTAASGGNASLLMQG
jgi:RHH-type proline utilization regulon transcriptional repressor/proline dehydrogenase/delta 1-pyrroline-5-carboxylate dehydrogenase